MEALQNTKMESIRLLNILCIQVYVSRKISDLKKGATYVDIFNVYSLVFFGKTVKKFLFTRVISLTNVLHVRFTSSFERFFLTAQFPLKNIDSN